MTSTLPSCAKTPRIAALLADRPLMGQAVGTLPGVGAHVPALDGLRGLAVLLVMLFHFSVVANPSTSLERIVFGALKTGWAGVDLFFVLSGFLITGILFDTKNSDHYFRNFFVRRALRIFPLYYGVLIAVYGGGWLAGWLGGAETRDVVKYAPWLWVYGGGFPVAIRQQWLYEGGWVQMSHFWSLAVEEHFYLIWPFVVYKCNRRTLLWICGVCMATALGCRVAFTLAYSNHLAAYVLTPCRIDGLSIGAALSLLVRSPGGVKRLVPWAWCGGLICAAAGCVLAWMTGRFWWDDAPVATVGMTLLAGMSGAFLVVALSVSRHSIIGRFVNAGVLRTFGKYSYGLYVFHHLLSPLFQRIFPVGPLTAALGARWIATCAVMALSLAATCLAAVLSWHLCEKRFLALKAYFEYPVRTQRPVAALSFETSCAPDAGLERGQRNAA